MSVKDVQNEREQPIVCNCLRICVYVYVCQCVEICVTRESNFVRFLRVYIRQNFYINYLLHRVFITYIIFILMTLRLYIIINVNYIIIIIIIRYALLFFLFYRRYCTKAEDAV